MFCSTRGTEIAGVEGLWLVSRPNHSISENPDNSPKVHVCSPFIVPSQNSMRDHCDIISWHHDCLLWSSGRKTTAHVHRKHHSFSVYPLASMPESLVSIDASEPVCLMLNLNSMPVTYIQWFTWITSTVVGNIWIWQMLLKCLILHNNDIQSCKGFISMGITNYTFRW